MTRNEKQVREVLDKIWKSPEHTSEIIKPMTQINKDIFEFEDKMNA